MIFLLMWQVLVTILCATMGLASSSGEEVLIVFLFWIFLCNLPFFFGVFND